MQIHTFCHFYMCTITNTPTICLRVSLCLCIVLCCIDSYPLYPSITLTHLYTQWLLLWAINLKTTYTHHKHYECSCKLYGCISEKKTKNFLAWSKVKKSTGRTQSQQSPWHRASLASTTSSSSSSSSVAALRTCCIRREKEATNTSMGIGNIVTLSSSISGVNAQ